MQNDPLPDQATPVNGNIRVKDGRIAHHGVPADENPRMENGFSADLRTAADMNAGVDHGIGRNNGPRFDGCLRADPAGLFLLRIKQRKQFPQRDIGIRYDQQIFPRADGSRRDENGAGARGGHPFPIFRIGDEREIPGAGLVDRSDPFDHHPAVAADAAVQK